MRPLEGIRVLDFSTLLPGPLATLMLAEAGAEVIKIERPPIGDEMRTYVPSIGRDSLMFAQLNRGKRSIAIDLKAPGSVERLMPLLRSTDVLVEQFRPGVMTRLGLGYETLRELNPRIVYCSLTGYGASGPKADKAAHDLNYVAESGMLALVPRPGEAPSMPPTLIADIGAGAYPAVINVLLGHMSLVGPRPEIPAIVQAHYQPWQYERFLVPQGITGWWQVNGRGGKLMYEHTEDDIYYVEHAGFGLDVKILWMTVRAVFRREGAF